MTPIERIPREELDRRHARVRQALQQFAPKASGLLAFSRLNIYYLSGSLVNGILWLPMDGEPALITRRGKDRARLESSLTLFGSYRSFSQVPAIFEELGSPLGPTVAAEFSGLSWDMGQLFAGKIPSLELKNGDMALSVARSVKTDYELAKMRLAGERHHASLHDVLPTRIHAGMSERDVAHKAWEVFFEHGHCGHMRMRNDEIFLGHVAAGESANYPSVFNGPVGLMGEHPAVPFMGYAGAVWKQGEPLVCDIGFSLEGYQTDKTQVYWPGRRSEIPDQAARAHDFCIEMQAWLAEHMVPGAIPSELYAHCVRESDRQGWTEGFMALESNKCVFVGHGIGLNIDEYPVIAKGFDAPLEKGMTLALEPKIGIPGLGMVGVENTFEVTDSGARCITGNEFEIVCLGDA